MRSALITTIFFFATLAGCRSPGLPPEPPAQDAANPEAGMVQPRPQANPFTRSAFEGVELGGGGHEHHHHHGHGAKPAAKETKPSEAPAKPSHEHGSHGGRP